MFHLALILHAGKHAAAKVRLIHSYQKRRVCVFAVTRMVTHTVGDHAAFLAGSANDVAARTHTKAIHSAKRRMLHHLVIGGRKPIVVAVTIHSGVELRLQLLDPDAHGKGLVLHHKPAGEKRLVGIACGMPDGKHHAVGKIGLIRRKAHGLFGTDQIGHLGAKAHFTAKADDLLPDVADGRAQAIGADVRFIEVEDLLGRAELNEGFQYKAGKFLFLDAAVQLSVRESARAAFAVFRVGVWVQNALLPKSVHLSLPLFNREAALQHDG